MNWKEKLRIAWLLSSGEIKDFRPLEETVTEIIEKLIEDVALLEVVLDNEKDIPKQLRAKWLN